MYTLDDETRFALSADFLAAMAEYAAMRAALDAGPVDYTWSEHCSVHPDYAYAYANDE